MQDLRACCAHASAYVTLTAIAAQAPPGPAAVADGVRRGLTTDCPNAEL